MNFAASMMSIYFNPRSPHGERQYNNKPFDDYLQFQSTLPAWGATNEL